MTFQEVLQGNKSDIALVIGNGINRYGPAPTTNSWRDLLLVLAKECLPPDRCAIPNGISLTEFYDVLELRSGPIDPTGNLQRKFCALMSKWQPYEHHQRIVHWAQNHNVPILTTNFEEVLSDAGQCTLHPGNRKGFTDLYPWETYYAKAPLTTPMDGFGIWHINGMQRYSRSVRLGLSHYMGSVERARRLIKGKEATLYSGKDIKEWAGAHTWLHILFSKPLLFFGLALEENEVFLRWLMIERARYFRKCPDRAKLAWFTYNENDTNLGRLYYLEGVGVKGIPISNFDEVYGIDVWV